MCICFAQECCIWVVFKASAAILNNTRNCGTEVIFICNRQKATIQVQHLPEMH